MSYDDLEKPGRVQVEETITEDSNDEIIRVFSETEQKRIIRRVDLRLILPLGTLYCFSLIDRTNLGAAAVAGLIPDLGLIGATYSILTLVFFIPYILCEPAATFLVRKIGPQRFLTAIILSSGATMIGFGFTRNWTALAGLRAILGLLEAGFFPSCTYLLSCWYTRYELQKRNAVFYFIGNGLSGISGFLAEGLVEMKGLGGLAGWRWIFVFEGLMTCLAALAGYFFIIDFPERSTNLWKFLDEHEAAFVVARIDKDRGDAFPGHFSIGNYLKNAFDLKVWAFAWLFMLTTTSGYAINYFAPIIIHDGMGFSTNTTQLLIVPPYAVSLKVMLTEAYFADKLRLRGPFIAFNAILGLVGIALLGFSSHNGVRYFGIFLATICANANVPAVLTYQANNIRGQWKRALCSATLVGFGGIGGIIGSTAFRTQDAPQYRPGTEACLIANGLIVVIVGALTLKFWRANKCADAGGEMIEGQLGFRYTL